jgi:hypothetical protein
MPPSQPKAHFPSPHAQPIYDPSMRHPVFFTSAFMRAPPGNGSRPIVGGGTASPVAEGYVFSERGVRDGVTKL